MTLRVDLRLSFPALAALGMAWVNVSGRALLGLGLLAGAGALGAGYAAVRKAIFCPLLAATLLAGAASLACGSLAVHQARLEITDVSLSGRPAAATYSPEVQVEATVVSRPKMRTAPWGESYCEALLAPQSVNEARAAKQARGTDSHRNIVIGPRARIRVELDCSALPGQHFSARGRLEPQTGRREAAFLRARQSQISGEGSGVTRIVARIGASLDAVLADFSPPARGLIPGVALGNDSQVPDELNAAMKMTSLTHLTAVSGGHVSIMTVLVLLVVGRRNRYLSGLACSVALFALVALVGTEASVLRAVLMGSVVLLAMFLGKNAHAFSALATACLLASIIDPWLATSYGFLLSVSATAGIIIAGRPLADHLSMILPPGLADACAVPLVAQISCAPVLALFSDTGSVWGVLANALVAPVVAPLTLLGLGAAVAAPLCTPLATLLAGGASLCTWWLAAVARHLAAWPGSGIPLLLATLVQLGMLGAAALPWRRYFPPGVVARMPAHRRVLNYLRGIGVAGWLLLACTVVAGGGALWWYFSPVASAIPEDWEAVQCDVGQGSALIARKNGKTLMIDLGPPGGGAAQCLREAGVTHLDVLVLSHFHMDHVGDLPAVLEAVSVGETWISPNYAPLENSAWALAKLAAAGIRVREVTAGTEFTAGGADFAKVVWPRGAVDSDKRANADSIVVEIDVAGGVTVLADTDRESQERMAQSLSPARTVIVGHHGSADHSVRIPQLLRPRYALVSVGENDYGHPAPSIYQSFAGSEIFETQRCGAITLRGSEALSRCSP